MNFLASSKPSHRTATRLLAAAALCAASGAHAQAIPKTVRLIVAYPAGGVSDVVARALGDRLAAQLGVTVIVDNRAGATASMPMARRWASRRSARWC